MTTKLIAPALLPLCNLRLRILATTDLHAHLSPWDYYLDQAQAGYGLARVATLMKAARQEAENCLYFDNGDLIEGSPLAEYALQKASLGQKQIHPMVAALNALGCDAASLGNHEFSYGAAFLQKTMLGADYPVLSANILTRMGETVADDLPLFAPWAMLERSFADSTGRKHDLRIGVIGLTPPQVLEWDRALLSLDLQARDMVAVATHYIPLIRAAGADLVIALAHTGLGEKDGSASAENVGLLIAALPGLDAVVLGHEHQVFPTPGVENLKAKGPAPNPSHGIPVVMPGAFGSHLGVIDLDLVHDGSCWRVQDSAAECRPVASRGPHGEVVALVQADPAIKAQARASHQATRRLIAQPVGASAVPLHSYFAIVQPNAMQALIADAQAAYLAEVIAGTAWEGLPILSATAPFKTGGRGGPDYFSNVPAGPLLLRHAADLYHYPNRFAALAISGAGIRDWLERAATSYAQVRPGLQDQPLLNPSFPATCQEMIYGLSYSIDLSAPAGHEAPTGRPVLQPSGAAGRIRDLRYKGQPVSDDMKFVLATNSHRLGVILGAAGDMQPDVIADGTGKPDSRAVLLRYLASQPCSPERDLSQPAPLPRLLEQWSFCKMPGTSVMIDTSPSAVPYLREISQFAPEVLGLSVEGFLRLRLHL